MQATSTRPALPPLLVSYLSGKTRDAQARAVGWSGSTLARHLRSGWGIWSIESAEAYCAVCGFDFWSLTLETQANRDRLKNVTWLPVGKRLRRVLLEVFRSAGVTKPTQSEIEELATSFHQLSRRNG